MSQVLVWLRLGQCYQTVIEMQDGSDELGRVEMTYRRGLWRIPTLCTQCNTAITDYLQT